MTKKREKEKGKGPAKAEPVEAQETRAGQDTDEGQAHIIIPGEEEARRVLEEDMEQLGSEAIEELKEKAAERDKFLNMLQRTKADFDNYQKRVLREMEALKTHVLSEFIRELLPILDDFERAISSAEKNPDFESFHKGVKLIDRRMREVLQRHEVEPIEALGEVFDPNFHEALLVEETEEHPDNTVISELQKGYRMPGRILRPSKVKIARKKETAAGADEEEKGSDKCDRPESDRAVKEENN